MAMRMNKNGSFSMASRVKSFRDAGRGLVSLLATEPNARIHLAAAICAVVAGIVLQIGSSDWRWLVLAIGWVWFAEAINTSIEHLCDVVTRETHPGIRIAKDVAAAGVLISAVAAATIGLMIFLPHLR
jgi:diacylglycerol kinase (ATP)